MVTPTQRDAREHPRADVKIPVDYHFGRVSGRGQTTNISQSGLFIPAEELAPVGSRIYLRLHLARKEGGELLQVVGIVVRVVEQAGQAGVERGMGVHFEVAVGPTREALGYFVGSLLERPDHEIVTVPCEDGESEQFAVRLSSPPLDKVAAHVELSLENISGIFSYAQSTTSSGLPLWLKILMALSIAVGTLYAVAWYMSQQGAG